MFIKLRGYDFPHTQIKSLDHLNRTCLSALSSFFLLIFILRSKLLTTQVKEVKMAWFPISKIITCFVTLHPYPQVQSKNSWEAWSPCWKVITCNKRVKIVERLDCPCLKVYGCLRLSSWHQPSSTPWAWELHQRDCLDANSKPSISPGPFLEKCMGHGQHGLWNTCTCAWQG